MRVFGRPWARRLGLILALGLATVVALPAYAQAPRAVTVREIEVEGTQRIDPDTVRSYVLLKPGEAASEEELDRSLKALFATGLFADVTLRMERDRLFVRVVENPIINRIAFEGNRKLNDTALTAEVQLRPRVVYTRTKVQNDVKRILDLYRRNGRFAATVEPKVVQLPQNRVDLIYEINEGAVTGVRRINFIGNKQFSDGTLREVIRTVESRWWRILSTDDNYDPDRVSFDRELLRKYYLSNGYADFRVVSAVAELTPDRDGFYITFTIDEGERYRFGDLDVTSQLRDVKAEDLRGRVLAIGGLKEKVLAAHREGLKVVLYPEQNRKDLEDIPAEIVADLKLLPVGHFKQVLELALVPESGAVSAAYPPAGRPGVSDNPPQPAPGGLS